MAWIRTEEEVEQMIEKMIQRSKGKYITQGVSFNKDSPRQMELLKKALMSSSSFSGLIKELLAIKFSGESQETTQIHQRQPQMQPKKINIGNFL